MKYEAEKTFHLHTKVVFFEVITSLVDFSIICGQSSKNTNDLKNEISVLIKI